MINYEKARNRFEGTNKPPRSKKYADNQRPLRRVSESHLMLQKDQHSYVYIINGNEVVRVFEPNDQGEYEVAIRGLYNTYDINLMYQFTGVFSRQKFETTRGDTVCVPYNDRYEEQGKDFSAVLTFDSSDKLIVEKSWHADVYRLASTQQDKDTRKKLKAELDAYVTLQMFKLPTIKEKAQVSGHMGRPFGESDLSYTIQHNMRKFLEEQPLPLESQRFMETFDEVAQDCFNMLASKKIYNENYSLFYKYEGYWASRNPDEQADAREKVMDIIESVTPEDFKKSLVTRILSFAGLSKGTQSVALPQFGNTLPRTFYTRANKT